jgi:hypothetical protein
MESRLTDGTSIDAGNHHRVRAGKPAVEGDVDAHQQHINGAGGLLDQGRIAGLNLDILIEFLGRERLAWISGWKRGRRRGDGRGKAGRHGDAGWAGARTARCCRRSLFKHSRGRRLRRPGDAQRQRHRRQRDEGRLKRAARIAGHNV